jgi:hypothetical protein
VGVFARLLPARKSIVEVVNVFVNGRNLVDVLREVVLPFTVQEGKPDLAGSYVGLSVSRRRTATVLKARSPSSAACAVIRVAGLSGSG